MAKKRDYYEILGVSRNATDAEIKSAFRRLAKKYHPDVSKEPDAEEKFKEAQEAYAVLSDKNRRKQYDQFGHAAFSGSGGTGGFDFRDFDFSDIFEEIFGSAFGFPFGVRTHSHRKRRGADISVRMTITFEEAVFGCKNKISLDLLDTCDKCDGRGGKGEKTCSNCHGSGSITQEQRTPFGVYLTRKTCSVCGGEGYEFESICSSCKGTGRLNKTKEFTVNVPAGIDTGQQLRLAGKGEAGEKGAPPGDLYIEFTVLKHDLFIRDDSDIYLELPLTITQAVLGDKVDVPTLTGKVKLTIPPGTQDGDKHRLKGKGIKSLNSNRVGDLYVITRIIIPKTLSKEQKELFEKLNKTNLDNDKAFKIFREHLK